VKIRHILLPFVLCAGLVGTANAGVPCGARDAIIKMLSDKYREKPKALGIAGEKSLFEIYTSKAGSWTLLVTDASGQSCIVGAGQSWEDIPQTAELTAL
jgi:hypothetical protein